MKPIMIRARIIRCSTGQEQTEVHTPQNGEQEKWRKRKALFNLLLDDVTKHNLSPIRVKFFV